MTSAVSNASAESAHASPGRKILMGLFTIQVIILGVFITNKTLQNVFLGSVIPVPLYASTESVVDLRKPIVMNESRFYHLPFKHNDPHKDNTTNNHSTAPVLSSGDSSINESIIGINLFPSLPNLFKVPRQSHKQVPRVISPDEYQTIMRLVQLVTRVLDEQNITYTLGYGSLLGSYMMHDMLAWDDDVDIFIHNRTKALVMTMFHDDRHYGIRGHHHYKHPGELYKLFFSKSQSAGGYPWKYPFIDIVSYVDYGKDHFKAVQRGEHLTWPRASFFPQHRRPFGPLWLWAPKEPWVFLKNKYKEFKCQSSSWNHKNERWQNPKSGSCKDLASDYPFVQRSYFSANVTRETLMLKDKELYSVFVNEPFYKQSNMYSILSKK